MVPAIALSTSGSDSSSRTTRETSRRPRSRARVSRSSEAIAQGYVVDLLPFVGSMQLRLEWTALPAAVLALSLAGCSTGAGGGSGLRRNAVGDDRSPCMAIARRRPQLEARARTRRRPRGRLLGAGRGGGRAARRAARRLRRHRPDARAPDTAAVRIADNPLPSHRPALRAGRLRPRLGVG